MKIRTSKKKKFSANTKKHLERKQNTLLQFETFTYYKNRRVRLHYKSDTFVKERINRIQVTNNEFNKTKLRDFEKKNIDHYTDSKEITKIF